MDILSAENIKKSFDEKVILDGVNLTLRQGELISLLGVSGARQDHLFNCISGIDRPDSGRVVLGGQDITGQPGHISYMLQKDLLLPYKKIIDNVSLPLLLSGKSKKEARQKPAVTLPSSVWRAPSSSTRRNCPAVCASGQPCCAPTWPVTG